MTDAEPLDATERRQLCDLFLELGPDAPTLCEGWDVADLAAHLVIRERDPRAALAIVGGDRFRSLEERLMGQAAETGLPAMVERLRSGPPLIPWRVPGLRPTLNLNEWFVHHEDVRRANGRSPRAISDELDAALWSLLGRSGRLLVRGARGLGLKLSAPGHGEQRVTAGSRDILLTGPAQELTLYLNGRRDHAQVEVIGSDEARAELDAANMGV